jgi:ParB family transcriptional regulator, chromosome partitioning protein
LGRVLYDDWGWGNAELGEYCTHTCTDREAEELAAFENVKRADLNPIDETNMVINMIKLRLNLADRQAAIDLVTLIHSRNRNKSKANNDSSNVTAIERAEEINETIRQFTKGQLQLGSFAGNKLKLLNLPKDILEAIGEGFDYTKAVEIAKVKDPEQRSDLLRFFPIKQQN